MKKPLITLEEVPAPGEPLVPKIHEDNQRLLSEEIAIRTERVRAKLTPKTFKALKKRYSELHKILNRGQYNELIKERWYLKQTLEGLKHTIATAGGGKRDKAKARVIDIKARGRIVHEAVLKLQPLADEFEAVARRLNAHQAVLAWEKEDAENRIAFRREAVVWEAQIKAVMRQSARLHHKGEDKEGRPFIDIPVIEQTLFLDDRVLYQIRTTHQGFLDRLFGRWHSALPYDVDVADLICEETLENLSAGCNRVVTVERSKNGKNLFYAISRLDAPDGIPKRVLYSKVIDWYPSEDHAKTPWPMGVTKDKKVEWITFEEFSHMLLAGSSNGGKSNHLNAMIATMCTMNTPDELGLLLIDLKGGIEFTHWSGLKHQIRPMVKSAGEVLEALQFMRAIMERRLAMFESLKAKNLETYNKHAREKLPRLIVVVDEMATLMGLGDLTTAIHTELRTLSSQGRAVGIHLVLCTQHSSIDIVPGWIKTNMSIRASTSMPTDVASMVILGTPAAAHLPKIPGRIVFAKGREDTIAQSPYISDNEIARAVDISKAYPDADRTEFTPTKVAEVIKPKEKFTKDELFEIVLREFEGKISATRVYKYLGGKENDVITERKLKALVNEVLEIGLQKGIDYGGNHYTLKKVKGPGNYTMILSRPVTAPDIESDTQEILLSSLPSYPDTELETA